MILKLSAAAVLAAALAFAQGGRGGRGGDRDAEAIGPPVRQQKATKADQVADRLKLNKEQKNELEAALQESYQETAPLRQKLLRGRNAIALAMVAGKSQDEIDPLVKSYAALSAEMTLAETKVLATICAKLKPNQQAKAGQAFDLMAEILDSSDLSAGRGAGK